MTTWQYQRVETALTSATITTIARLLDGFGVELEELFARLDVPVHRAGAPKESTRRGDAKPRG
jgi:hypothetical protein